MRSRCFLALLEHRPYSRSSASDLHLVRTGIVAGFWSRRVHFSDRHLTFYRLSSVAGTGCKPMSSDWPSKPAHEEHISS